MKSERYECDVTLSAAFPVDSSSNSDRRDMRDLDFLFGIGPQLILKCVNKPGHSALNLHLNACAVYSTDFPSFPLNHRKNRALILIDVLYLSN